MFLLHGSCLSQHLQKNSASAALVLILMENVLKAWEAIWSLVLRSSPIFNEVVVDEVQGI